MRIGKPYIPAPRPEVAALAADAHGGPDHAELAALGLAPQDVLDFSASTNAYGPPPGVAEALAGCDLQRYPDRGAAPLRQALAAREGVDCARLMCGNGAAQLIACIALAYLRAGDTALVVGPTFGEYRVAAQLMGASVVEARGDATRGFRPYPGHVAALAAAAQPRLAWLCNPNNPTGVYLESGEVNELLAAAPGALWVIDESYRPFTGAPWCSLPLVACGNVVLLRSLTKDHALPGLRLGYALSSPPVTAALQAVQPPWSVSAPAIAAGLAALAGEAHVASTLAALRSNAADLSAALSAQGWPVLPSSTHFFLVQVGDASAVRARLLARHHIQVRDCASFGLPDYIRIAARTPAENRQLCEALGSPGSPPG